MRPFAIALLALTLPSGGSGGGALAAEAPLPDTIFAAVGSRVVTRSEFQRQWDRIGSLASPPTRPLAERRRDFLNELVNKELLTLATAEMNFVPSPPDSARLGLLRLNLMRLAYYNLMIVDSLPPEDPASAHSHAPGEHAAPPTPDAAAEADRAALQRAAESRLMARLVAPIHPQWDEGVAEGLAAAFRKLPPPKEEGPGWLRWNYTAWMPPVAASDTAKILGRSDLGPFSVGRFLWHWGQVPPAQRDRPDSAAAVLEWARNFLAQGVLDQEARRMDLGHAPDVEAKVAEERQIMALDAYYRANVSTKVDTSEARLRSLWSKNPRRYDGQPSSLYEGLWYRRFDDADTAGAWLRRGAPWDSVLAARYPMPAEPEEARLVRSEAELYRYPQVQLPTTPDTTLTRWFATAKKGEVFGPRNRAGQWWVYRFLDRRDGKRRTFDEARSFVAQLAAYDDEEKALSDHLAALRKRYGVRVNSSALAALPSTEPK